MWVLTELSLRMAGHRPAVEDDTALPHRYRMDCDQAHDADIACVPDYRRCRVFWRRQ